MSGEIWPKEEQRMCNGASGQVPIGVNPSPSTWEHEKDMDALCAATEIADNILELSSSAADSSTLIAAHVTATAQIYTAHVLAKALRELAPEVAGAISEAGTDIGAGIALAFEQALKNFPDDNTHSD